MNFPAPFSQRQMEYMNRCFNSWFNVAEGGKRGSKNVLQTYIFCKMLETHPNKIHLVAGVSSATASLNIVDCDGYGIENYFEGRYRHGKYQNRACIYVLTATGEKVILVSGGGKDGDEKLIKGNTYGMAYITEANECHPKFLKEVFDRTLSSADRKIFHDLNPKEPGHPYYTEILDFYEKEQNKDSAFGYNYGHFTIADNMSMSDEKVRAVLRTYQKGTVWYERDIKGQRIVAEGIIFRYFAENQENYLFDEEDIFDGKNVLKKRFSKLTIGIDFGGNGSKTTFVLNGFINGFQEFRILEEDGLPITEEIDTNAICNKFVECYTKWRDTYGHIDWVFPDSASTTLINSLRSAARKAHIDSRHIAGVIKNKVEDRPRSMDRLLTTGRLKVARKCVNIRMALANLKWDDNQPNIPEDKNINNINDWWDALMYTMLDYITAIDNS